MKGHQLTSAVPFSTVVVCGVDCIASVLLQTTSLLYNSRSSLRLGEAPAFVGTLPPLSLATWIPFLQGGLAGAGCMRYGFASSCENVRFTMIDYDAWLAGPNLSISERISGSLLARSQCETVGQPPVCAAGFLMADAATTLRPMALNNNWTDCDYELHIIASSQNAPG